MIISTGIQGEKYPCKPDIFHATYYEVTKDVYEDLSQKKETSNMKQHIRDVRLETLSRIKQHSYYDEIQGLFETIAGHCEVARKDKMNLL